jgi:hypothetical protein
MHKLSGIGPACVGEVPLLTWTSLPAAAKRMLLAGS